jgi:hypothetical protein
MALRRQLGSRGLLSYFNKDGEFQLWINMMLSLAFVPVAEVSKVYEDVILEYLDQHTQEWESAAERIGKFKQYFEDTYVLHRQRRLAMKLEKLRRKVLPSSALTAGTNTRMSSREML